MPNLERRAISLECCSRATARATAHSACRSGRSASRDERLRRRRPHGRDQGGSGRFVIMGDTDDSYDFCGPRCLCRAAVARLPSGGWQPIGRADEARHRDSQRERRLLLRWNGSRSLSGVWRIAEFLAMAGTPPCRRRAGVLRFRICHLPTVCAGDAQLSRNLPIGAIFLTGQCDSRT
jgi:hypothetical protein